MTFYKNVIVFGETGSGKSSVINLLLSRKVAKVSDAAVGCTFDFECYPHEGYNFYDTVGLSEGSHGLLSAEKAISNLIKLLKSLKNGVNLLILVMKSGKITQELERNYKLFVEGICMNKVPVILVVTHCEHYDNMNQWWSDNQKYFENYGMIFKYCTCVCASKGEGLSRDFARLMEIKYLQSRDNLYMSIKRLVLPEGWKMKSWSHWFAIIIKKVWNSVASVLDLRSILCYIPKLRRLLIDSGYNERTATEIANEIYEAFVNAGREESSTTESANLRKVLIGSGFKEPIATKLTNEIYEDFVKSGREESNTTESVNETHEESIDIHYINNFRQLFIRYNIPELLIRKDKAKEELEESQKLYKKLSYLYQRIERNLDETKRALTEREELNQLNQDLNQHNVDHKKIIREAKQNYDKIKKCFDANKSRIEFLLSTSKKIIFGKSGRTRNEISPVIVELLGHICQLEAIKDEFEVSEKFFNSLVKDGSNNEFTFELHSNLQKITKLINSSYFKPNEIIKLCIDEQIPFIEQQTQLTPLAPTYHKVTKAASCKNNLPRSPALPKIPPRSSDVNPAIIQIYRNAMQFKLF